MCAAEEGRREAPAGAAAAELAELQARLGHRFRDPALLRRALTHRSYANEMGGAVADNEVLEFLGDAVLGLLVSELLYRRRPELSEGEMSKLKAYLVSAETLARQAERLGLGGHLLLGRGEEKTDGRAKDSLLANTLEAVIAAIYLDGELAAARRFVAAHLWPLVQGREVAEAALSDYKSLLQERVQAAALPPPVYRVVEETGPDHEKLFRVAVVVDGRPVGQGEGRTKKAAEQRAAERALRCLEGDGTLGPRE